MSEPKSNLLRDIWKEIPRFEPYRASNQGRISIDGSILVGCVRPNGYEFVYLSKLKKFKSTHTLVALAFLGPKPPGHVTHHIDQVKLHNFPENLTYVTQKEHHHLHPTRIANLTRNGALNHNAKLSDSKVRLIRQMNQDGWTQRELSRAFGVCFQTIRKVLDRHIWKHV